MSNKLVESEIHDTMDNNVQKFIDLWIKNKDCDTIDLISHALELNIIRKNRNVYYYGIDIIGNFQKEAVAWFKDVHNKEVV